LSRAALARSRIFISPAPRFVADVRRGAPIPLQQWRSRRAAIDLNAPASIRELSDPAGHERHGALAFARSLLMTLAA
jgi:hypothetical protein